MCVSHQNKKGLPNWNQYIRHQGLYKLLIIKMNRCNDWCDLSSSGARVTPQLYAIDLEYNFLY